MRAHQRENTSILQLTRSGVIPLPRIVAQIVLALALVLLLGHSLIGSKAADYARGSVSSANRDSKTSLANGHLSFEPNHGQLMSGVKFLSRGSGYRIALFPTYLSVFLNHGHSEDRESYSGVRNALSYSQQASISMGFADGNHSSTIEGLDRLTRETNYFTVLDTKKSYRNIPNYARARYRNIYPGIDLTFYGVQQGLEYDFWVNAGSDPERIGLILSGVDKIEIDRHGDLLLNIGGAQLRQLKPFIYQTTNGVRKQIDGGYTLKNKNQVGFWVGKYDKTKTLVIDPVIIFSTYLGGSLADESSGTAVDSEGNMYMVGTTDSLNFPSSTGVVQPTLNSGKDVFVTKLKASGELVYSTYIGGGGDDFGSSISVDGDGNAYITGTTSSSNFPTTPGALQTVNSGGSDAFVVKLNQNGSALSYSTLLGGSANEEGLGIAVNSSGNAFLTGATTSNNFPTTVGALQAARNGVMDAFITKLNPSGSSAVYSTYLGGGGAEVGFGIALDSQGTNAFLTGVTDSLNYPTTQGSLQTSNAGQNDGFVTKLNNNGSATTYSTLIGGTGTDAALGIAVDSSGDAFVTGLTESANFPIAAAIQSTNAGGASDAFALKLNPNGSALSYSTYLGGSGTDVGAGIALDYNGAAYIAGTTNSANFTQPPGTSPPPLGGADDAFVLSVNKGGSALTYYNNVGGSQSEESFAIAVSLARDAYVTGTTKSTNFPTHSAFQITNAGNLESFASRISTVSTPQPINDPEYFVQQHYLDFLNRIPDAGGLAFWKNEITSCGSDTNCIDVKRINVSAAYFLSIEFQGTGFLVYRMYNAALNRRAAMPFRAEFLQDTREIGRGVIVNDPGWEQLLEANKVAFSTSFVQRAEFVSLYPTTQSPAQFVDALFAHAVITPDANDRLAAIAEFGSAGTSSDPAARGRVLRRIAENSTLTNREFNRAFVLMQYFGYLRRNPDDAPDNDLSGFNFWLTKLNQFGGNFVNAEMVKAFILSGEYQHRFAP